MNNETRILNDNQSISEPMDMYATIICRVNVPGNPKLLLKNLFLTKYVKKYLIGKMQDSDNIVTLPANFIHFQTNQLLIKGRGYSVKSSYRTSTPNSN